MTDEAQRTEPQRTEGYAGHGRHRGPVSVSERDQEAAPSGRHRRPQSAALQAPAAGAL